MSKPAKKSPSKKALRAPVTKQPSGTTIEVSGNKPDADTKQARVI
jgi:hypothetical protein